MKGLVGEAQLEHWWLSYVELLQKLQLFTQANEVGAGLATGCKGYAVKTGKKTVHYYKIQCRL